MTELVIGLLILALVLYVLSQRIPFSILSPVYVLIGAYLVIVGCGGFIYDPRYGGGGGRFPISVEDSFTLVADVTWMVIAFTIGALISGGRKPSNASKKNRQISIPKLKMRLTTAQAGLALIFGAVSMALLIFGAGLGNILFRTEYLPQEHHIPKIIGLSLLPVAVLGFGAASTVKGQIYRILGIFMAVMAGVLTLALNTRFFSLIPVLFFAGAFIMGPASKTRVAPKKGLVISILLAPILMVLPLTGRRMIEQGVLTFPELAVEVLTVEPEMTLHELSNDIFISAPITVATERANPGDALDYLSVSLNPLPGFMTTWADTVFLLNPQTPFNAIGDLLRVGTLASVLYFGVIGFYFGRIDRAMRKSIKPKASTLCLLAISYLFVLLTLQYPLRNATRLIYYMIGFEVLSFFAVALIKKKKSANKTAKLQELAPEFTMAESIF